VNTAAAPATRPSAWACGPTGFDAQGNNCRTKLQVPRTIEYTLGGEREVVQGLALGLDVFVRDFEHPYEIRETNRNLDRQRRLAGGHRQLQERPSGDGGRSGHPDEAQRHYRGATWASPSARAV
jgi:hypothetical protein